jgi:predicted small lipoprotein YifL
MKTVQILFLTTAVALFLSLAGCGGSNGEPELPPAPVDTGVVKEPPDTVYVPSWSNIGFLRGEIVGPYECANVIFKRRSNDYPYDEEAMTNIIGTWKLLLYNNGSWSYSIERDVSCRSVIYRFDADSTVTVISDTTAIPAGTFKYSYKYIDNWPDNYPDTLRIGEEEFDCWVVDSMLTFTPVWRISGDVGIHDAGGGLFIKIKE